MVEVFKTDVNEKHDANMLINQIHRIFIDYRANFDLDDCDRILRVKNITGSIQCSSLINLLKDFGFHAEPLPDTVIIVEKNWQVNLNHHFSIKT